MSDVSQQVTALMGAFGRRAFLKGACGVAAVGLGGSLAGCQSAPKGDTVDFQRVWPAPPADPRFFFEGTITGKNDVVQETAAERFRRMATGQSSVGERFEKPFGLAARDGVLFASDTAARMVHAFDLVSHKYWRVGTEGVGTLAKPLGIAIDKNMRLHVCDSSGRRAVVYEADGTYVTAMGNADELVRPSGIAVNSDGSRVFLVDTGGVSSQDHRVLVFDKSGKHLFNIGTRGSEEGNFNLPVTACVSPDDKYLYVVDGGNFRVQCFDLEGKFIRQIGAVGRVAGSFSRPKQVAVDLDGNVYVSDAAFGNVQIFNEQGDLLMWLGTRQQLNLPGYYMLPQGLAVDGVDGRLYFADQFFARVDIYRPAGQPEKRGERPSYAPKSADAKTS